MIIPNNNQDVHITDSFTKYAVPVSEVAKRTGYDLLRPLPPAVRTNLMNRNRVDVVHHDDGSSTLDGMHVPAFKSPFQSRQKNTSNDAVKRAPSSQPGATHGPTSALPSRSALPRAA